MLFIADPRQCGKTLLARKFLEEKGCSPLYCNWDIEKVRTRYREDTDFLSKMHRGYEKVEDRGLNRLD
ncbi:MAG: hypothetical protein U9Q84_09010 [Thermodesulfobacteriota bacterium]|nr:hypothetical protein [Thermodesulfobacteriota bacterium]